MTAKTRAEFPRDASHKITVCRNLSDFSFPVAQRLLDTQVSGENVSLNL